MDRSTLPPAALLTIALSLLVLLQSSCGKHAPREESLPRQLLVADFSASGAPVKQPGVTYGTFSGDGRAADRSIAEASQKQMAKETVLALDYRTGGYRLETMSCGLSLKFGEPPVLRKNWQAFAFEVKAAPETERVGSFKLRAALSTERREERPFKVDASQWRLCVVPFTSRETGYATPDEQFVELAVVIQNGATSPSPGRLLIRRVYLLASRADIPADIPREAVIVYEE